MYGLDKMVPMPYDNWINAVFPEDRADAEASVQRVILNRTRQSSVFRIIKPDNSLRYIHSSADVACEDSGRVIRVIGINTDIPERRLMENQIQENKAQLTI
jgi:PAS domain-containing protein